MKFLVEGYVEFTTKEFVSDEDAYFYAMEKVEADPELQKEFEEGELESIKQDESLQDEFVEWFYSGNWVRGTGRA